MSYTYHIALTGTAYTEFVPSVEPKITFQEVAGEMFLQPVIEEIKIGSTLNAAVYALLLADFFDPTKYASQMLILVKRNGVDAFHFRTSVSNTKIDTEKKTFMLSPEPDDGYQDVLDDYETEYDIGISLTETVHQYIHTTTDFVNVDFTSLDDIADVVSYVNDQAATQTARMAITPGATATGDKMVVVIRDLTITAGAAPKLNVANNLFADISNQVTLSATGMYTMTLTGTTASYIELTQAGSGGVDEGTFLYEIYYYSNAFCSGRSLNALLDVLLGASYMNTGLTMRSTFLFNDALPPEAPLVLSSYMTANPTHNYATSSANRLNSLYLCKADGLTTADADNYEITFKKLMEVLRYKFKSVYWYIDTEGYFRIEHGQYFKQMEVQIDLTSVTYAGYLPEIDRFLYNFDKSNVYFSIQYQESNEGGADFIADPIVYDKIKTSTKNLDISVPISTDISWMEANPGDASAEGFLLVETEQPADRIIPKFGASRTAGYYYQNQYLSWYSLFPLFWKYLGEADEADINNGTTLTLTHVKEMLRQGGIKFYHDGILTWYGAVTLTLGTAWIKKMELDLSSGFYSLDVGYDPYTI